MNALVRCVVDIVFRRHPIEVLCPERGIQSVKSEQLRRERHLMEHCRGEVELALLTYAVAVAFHLFPVFQVHGPDVALKQARRVRNCVCPRAADTKAVRFYPGAQAYFVKVALTADYLRLRLHSS